MNKTERMIYMKLIIAIVNRDDASSVADALLNNGFYSTKLSTTGGFLKTGNTTFLVGVEETKVDAALKCIKDNSQKRQQLMPDLSVYPVELMPTAIEVTVGGATVFVLDVDRFEKY